MLVAGAPRMDAAQPPTETKEGAVANDQVLVLNVSYEPIVLIHWHRAICLVLDEKVTVEAIEEGRALRSASAEFAYPAVIRLRRYVPSDRVRTVGTSRRSVLRRDGFVCVYRASSPVCVGRASSVDHVMPRSRGGGDESNNLVAACLPCNQFKGDRTPAELGWSTHRLNGVAAWPMLDLGDVPATWRPFLTSAA